MKRKCYFTNYGVTFDKNNKEEIHDTWNCNPLCCKADLCNGLWCEDYSIDFNKDSAIKSIKEYVKNGCNNTYGYIKEVEIDLDKDTWNQIYKDLVKDYNYKNIKEAKNNGFIPYDYTDILEDNCSYWEEPDMSFLKENYEIKENQLHIYKESELDKDIIDWVNNELYGIRKDNKEIENGGINDVSI